MDWLRCDDLAVLRPVLCLLPMLVGLCAGASAGSADASPTVDASFPGGNIVLEEVAGDEVRLHQDLRDTAGNWFWWLFRVRGARDRTLTFRFTKGNVIGTRGPAVSTDGGRTWAWLGREAVDGASFRYEFAADAQEVRFGFAIPYVEADLRDFLQPYGENPHLRLETLCTTRKGRKAERLRVGRLNGQPDYRVLLTCRHHACECMASYAVEGVIESVLADHDDGRWLRRHVEFLIVPFVDKDGVEEGDQGKNRKPHDHNRDYGDESIYPTVQAIRKFVPRWSAGRLRLTLDLHCPHIRGRYNEVIYLVGSPDAAIWEQQQAFGAILEAVRSGPLPYRAASNLPFGKAWNTHKNYGKHKSCSRWCSELDGVRLASTIEIPYATASGAAVTGDSARAFGRDLAKAIRRYIERLDEPPPAP
ncbi:MAG: M14 family zinc carboxypeptidase [Candidatus Brocadiia bacterium]